ncbi:MAG: hypothetical protein V4658_05315 [Bacteroidota bacterium]
MKYDSAGTSIDFTNTPLARTQFIFGTGYYSYEVCRKQLGSYYRIKDTLYFFPPGEPAILKMCGGETGFLENLFHQKLWTSSSIARMKFEIVKDSLHFSNRFGEHWLFLDSSLVNSNRIPKNAIPPDPLAVSLFSPLTAVRSYIYTNSTYPTDTINITQGKPSYSTPTLYFHTYKSMFWNPAMQLDTFRYVEHLSSLLHLTKELTLHFSESTSEADSSTFIWFGYYSNEKNNNGKADAALRFKIKNGKFIPLYSQPDSLYSSADKLPVAGYVRSIKVNGTKYKNVYALTSGTIKPLPDSEAFVFHHTDPVTKLYWAVGIGPVQIEYKSGKKQYLLSYQ